MNRPGYLALFAVTVVTLSGTGLLRAEGEGALFSANGVLPITLEGPIGALARDRAENPEERPGRLSYRDAAGMERTLTVRLEPRGKSRRDREVCTFPPLWVHLYKEAVGGTLFDKQKKLKMVTYCRTPKRFQDYILKEYLVYRIFNRLSEASFRVRLLEVSYRETGAAGRPLVRYGFFIEHKKRLAKRLDREVREPEARIPPAALEGAQAAIAELFQYMIGNTDFSFIAPPVDDTCCHNAVLLAGRDSPQPQAGEQSLYAPVPYDFDRTGLVDPPNGRPAAELGQRTFRDRVYRGFCRDPEYLQAALDETRSARADIEALIREAPALGRRSRDRALRFIAGYYEIISDPRRLDRALSCRPLH